MAVASTLTNDDVRRADRAHVFHSWSAQGKLNPLPLAGGEGVFVWDYEGRRYLDFSSQLVNTNLGHQHPKVVAAIREQAERLCTVAPQHANDVRNEAARLIAEAAGPGLERVFFTNAGAEANENAIRLARAFTGRAKVLAMYRSYHGATGNAIVATGDPRRWANETGVAGVVHFHGPYLYRSSFYATSADEERERALRHLEEVLRYEGPQTVAAIILEPIVGTNGILVPPDGYLEGVRELCTRHGIVLIADEVMAGFGRAGAWFAHQRWDVVPDLITFAKGVNSGYVPLGGVVIADPIADAFAERVFYGGLTYSGHPLACASAVASIRAFHEEGVVEHAEAIGREVLGPGLHDLMARHPSIGEVRGVGCFWCIELVRDRESREMLVPYNAGGAQMGPVAAIQREALAKGLLLMVHWNKIHVVPPLVISPEEARQGLAILDEVLAIADEAARG